MYMHIYIFVCMATLNGFSASDRWGRSSVYKFWVKITYMCVWVHVLVRFVHQLVRPSLQVSIGSANIIIFASSDVYTQFMIFHTLTWFLLSQHRLQAPSLVMSKHVWAEGLNITKCWLKGWKQSGLAQTNMGCTIHDIICFAQKLDFHSNIYFMPKPDTLQMHMQLNASLIWGWAECCAAHVIAMTKLVDWTRIEHVQLRYWTHIEHMIWCMLASILVQSVFNWLIEHICICIYLNLKRVGRHI